MKQRFHFSKAERVGIAVLGLIIVSLLVFLNIPRHNFVEDIFLEDSSKVAWVDSKDKIIDSLSIPKGLPKHIKPFNPNKLSKSEWKNLGFSEKQAQVIVSYKNKIGGFKSKSDIANCYVISDEKFQTIAPYIRFETEQTIAADSVKIEAVFEQIEINTATKSELESVKGIGPFYAKQILALRKDLGGYYSVEQLKEVYGMTQEAFEQIKPQLTVLPTEINKIEVSTAKFDALKRHPYLSWKQSQIIVSQKYKSIDSIFWSNLTNSGHFTESDIQRLKPYFK